jgi:hypothetical protein
MDKPDDAMLSLERMQLLEQYEDEQRESYERLTKLASQIRASMDLEIENLCIICKSNTSPSKLYCFTCNLNRLM